MKKIFAYFTLLLIIIGLLSTPLSAANKEYEDCFFCEYPEAIEFIFVHEDKAKIDELFNQFKADGYVTDYQDFRNLYDGSAQYSLYDSITTVTPEIQAAREGYTRQKQQGYTFEHSSPSSPSPETPSSTPPSPTQPDAAAPPPSPPPSEEKTAPAPVEEDTAQQKLNLYGSEIWSNINPLNAEGTTSVSDDKFTLVKDGDRQYFVPNDAKDGDRFYFSIVNKDSSSPIIFMTRYDNTGTVAKTGIALRKSGTEYPLAGIRYYDEPNKQYYWQLASTGDFYKIDGAGNILDAQGKASGLSLPQALGISSFDENDPVKTQLDGLKTELPDSLKSSAKESPSAMASQGSSSPLQSFKYGNTQLVVPTDPDGLLDYSSGQLLFPTGTISLSGLSDISEDPTKMQFELGDGILTITPQEKGNPLISMDKDGRTYQLTDNYFTSGEGEDKTYLAVADVDGQLLTQASSSPPTLAKIGGKVVMLYSSESSGSGFKSVLGYENQGLQDIKVEYSFSGPNGGFIYSTPGGGTFMAKSGSSSAIDSVSIPENHFFANGAIYYKDASGGQRCIDPENCIKVDSIAFQRHSLQELQSKMRGYPGLNMFIAEEDPLIEDETINSILGGIPGWSGLICRAADVFGVSTSNSASGAAFSDTLGGSYAHVEATKYGTYNFTEGKENIYAVYKVTYDFHPVGNCEGTFNIYLFSGSSSVALYTKSVDSEGNETAKYMRTNQPMIFNSKKDFDKICMTFTDLSPGCFPTKNICNIVQKGNDIVPTDIRTPEEEEAEGADGTGITVNLESLG